MEIIAKFNGEKSIDRVIESLEKFSYYKKEILGGTKYFFKFTEQNISFQLTFYGNFKDSGAIASNICDTNRCIEYYKKLLIKTIDAYSNDIKYDYIIRKKQIKNNSL